MVDAAAAPQSSQASSPGHGKLTVGLLREVGLPARYVSGYLHPQPEAQQGDEMVGESHAWVEYWRASGWPAIRPTGRR
jgi:transglutaminase-like putative cysteine protease